MFGFVSGLFLLLVFMSILMPVPYCFGFCSFVISFEMGRCEASNFVLLFQDFLAIWGPLHFYMNLRTGFSTSTTNKQTNKSKAIGIFIGIASNLWVNLGSTVISKNTKSSNLRTHILFIYLVFENYLQ